MGISVRAGAAVAAASAVLALGACGSSSSQVAADPAPGSSTPTATLSPTTVPSTPTSPACAGVWRSGHRLDASYRGCATSQGWVKAAVYQCSDGHRMVTYAHAFYAQPGHKITRSPSTLAKDTAFRHLMAVCGA